MRKLIIKFSLLLLVFVGLMSQGVDAQILEPDSVLHKNRLYWVAGIEGSLWAGSLVALNYAWYKDYNSGDFHTFNDNEEWLQVDKFGHITTSYYLGKIGFDMLRWSGVSEKKSILYGGSLGFLYLTSVELLDAQSNGWGFSWGDMAANAVGSGLFMGQQALWGEQRIFMKYSFHTTKYAQYRPNVLGSTLAEQMVKDYNGHTYWLSGNIYSFLDEQSKFPKWFNVAIGYGAEGMLGGFENPEDIDGLPLPEFDRYRQYYISLDVDLTRIKTRSKFLRGVFNVLSFIKIPMPTIEFSEKGTTFHPLYF
ncbi:MAG: DUF2279 domain-containing protein [Bacteroidales bacterium]|nr:DUF2279 domain-containing protein [Bacteroidales bacterium]